MPVIPVALSDSRNAPPRAPIYLELWWVDPRTGHPAKEVLSAPVIGGRAEFPALPPVDPALRWAIVVREMGAAGPLLRTGPLAHLPSTWSRLHVFAEGLSVFRGGAVSFAFSGDYGTWLRDTLLERLAPLAPALRVEDAAFASVAVPGGDLRLQVTLTGRVRVLPFLTAAFGARVRLATAPAQEPGIGPAVRVWADGPPEIDASPFVRGSATARILAIVPTVASAVADVIQQEMTGEIVPSLSRIDDLRFAANTVAAGRASFGPGAGVELVVNPGQVSLLPDVVVASA